MRGSKGVAGGPDPPPPENHKNIGFIGNTDPDPVKIHKATKPAFNVGNHWPAGHTTFKWPFAGGPIMARF